MLGRGEGILAGPDPGAPVGHSGQLAAADAAEQAAVWGSAELREMVAQQLSQLGMDGHDPAVAIGAGLEVAAGLAGAIFAGVAHYRGCLDPPDG